MRQIQANAPATINKMKSITEVLIQDHARLRDLFNDFKSVKNRNPKKAKQILARFYHALRKHFTAEEEVLMFAKKNFINNNITEYSRTIRRDHQEILYLLKKLLTEVVRKNGLLDTHDLRNALNKHELSEENIFYPELDQLLTPKQKKRIIERIKEHQ